MFPPAKLSLKDSIDEYAQILRGPKGILVDRLCVSANSLPEFASLRAEDTRSLSYATSVIGTVSTSSEAWFADRDRDGELMSRFDNPPEGNRDIEAYEVSVPDSRNLHRYLEELQRFQGIEVFVELPWDDDVPAAMVAIAETDFATVKARTGGTHRDSFPTADQLAQLILQAIHLEIDFKLTAGLHQPIAHDNLGLAVRHHGFLNILLACSLGAQQDLTRSEIAEILEWDDAETFRFDGEILYWHGLEVSLEQLSNGRDYFLGFGSCSVDEPIAGLQKLGLLPSFESTDSR